ncbi:MAG: vitamin B12-dependent ribonucleotide reductase [Candidatus Jacksonbacteria bacterium]|jgi:ribonucleoside-diphosphate reductase alpha chain|nr:vitamin B12-dependent ribonucleotide reductase [Candidatus Jacksonbacteria bacterium]MBT6034757.1 vitamin B12-dependent ribonucleotide reductase [Candidatus Jacksonbacteria bacterium]MBT6301195.1 vitamin B12-dependent ribonucleotide reductase [Candidatus Jacksonbacteria bacterium]MBT6757058.1 vitamin B12-dependent ribonucleotide reductase [Candidatus Jacksonbacteria bacterium]MBT6954798.1 vitamin B12-dependent ribonucleotide reductase [Candidatus Jacksonbacteria bacterium]
MSSSSSSSSSSKTTAKVERLNGYYAKVTVPSEAIPHLKEQTGMRFTRRFTRPGVDPLEEITYEKRTTKITNPDGSIVFEMKDAYIPASWTQIAADIMVSKYFRKAGVPQTDEDGKEKKDDNGEAVLGPERSAKQVVARLAGCWRFWGEKYNYFASPEDAQIFEDELKYMLIHQYAAPNSPQWFNTGLNWAYGITGPAQGHHYVDPDSEKLKESEDAYTHPQPHACFIQAVSDDLVNDGGIMDLWIRESRLFKYGSGTGTNFSNLRGRGEKLSGGGQSSGLMSFLKIGDAAAGAIKSGGTTRRAAKMVCLDLDHPEIEGFINWKVKEEKKVAALISAGYDSHFEGEAYQTVTGQNSNNSIRVPHAFMHELDKDGSWNLVARTDGSIMKEMPAKELWDQVAHAAWVCADPGVQYDDTINEWHTCAQSGRIRASNPCSEYMFLDDTACNLASINLIKFYDTETRKFDVESYKHAIRLWTVVLEISVLMAQYPSKEIAERSFIYRTLGLGYANLGTVLMVSGIPYDSDEARAIAGSLTAVLTGESYSTSAEMASFLGPFSGYKENREDMLRVMRNHRRAAYDESETEYEGLEVFPHGIKKDNAPEYLVKAAQEAWDKAVVWGEEHGYRNAQTTVIAPTGTIGLLMDCDTTGVEPDFALVKFKKLAGGGYFKIANQSIEPALNALEYSKEEMKDIMHHVIGSMSLDGAPHVNVESLKEKGFSEEDITKVEDQLTSVFDFSFAFNKFALGEDALKRAGLSDEQIQDPSLNVLEVLGFSDQEIQVAHNYICGHMTLEGAPHIKDEHLYVFDCANKCGDGERFIEPMAHVKMMAAVQPFISGSISKTVNLPNEATVEEIEDIYHKAWEWGVKSIALYRDGSKLSQPLNAKKDKKDSDTEEAQEEEVLEKVETATSAEAPVAAKQPQSAGDRASYQPTGTLPLPLSLTRGEKRPLPKKRNGITVEARVSGHKIFLRTGEYEDGTIGEIFIDMHKEGAAFRSMMNCFSIAISHALQYGVPLEKLIKSFSFTRFEPHGMTDHPNIKTATSVIDFIFRILAMEYLGRTDLVHVTPEQTGTVIRVQEVAEQQKVQLDIIDHPVEEVGSVEEKREEVKEPIAEAEVMAEPEVEKEPTAVSDGPGALSEKGSTSDASMVNKFMSDMMGDAPACDQCGHITVRNGSCYKCLNCGNSLGCS